MHRMRLAESRVVPAERFRLGPLWLALVPSVFDDDTHAMTAVVIGEIAQHPHAGMFHFDERGDALRGS